jgi:hypothetical protein
MYCISIKNIKKCENGLVIAQAKWFLNILNPNLYTNYISRISALFIENLPRMLPTKLQFICRSVFKGAYFLEINQSETRIACGGHVC